MNIKPQFKKELIESFKIKELEEEKYNVIVLTKKKEVINFICYKDMSKRKNIRKYLSNIRKNNKNYKNIKQKAINIGILIDEEYNIIFDTFKPKRIIKNKKINRKPQAYYNKKYLDKGDNRIKKYLKRLKVISEQNNKPFPEKHKENAIRLGILTY